MSQYRKKPIEVEARQYCDCHPEAIIEWAGAHFIEVHTDERDPDNPNRFLTEQVLTIRTREGEMVVSPGDYVIKEPNPTSDRRFYPCKPDIFEATYEPAGSDESEQQPR